MTFRAGYFPDTGPSYRGTVTVNDDGTGVFVSDQVQSGDGTGGFTTDDGTFSKALDITAVQSLQEGGQCGIERLVTLNG